MSIKEIDESSLRPDDLAEAPPVVRNMYYEEFKDYLIAEEKMKRLEAYKKEKRSALYECVFAARVEPDYSLGVFYVNSAKVEDIAITLADTSASIDKRIRTAKLRHERYILAENRLDVSTKYILRGFRPYVMDYQEDREIKDQAIKKAIKAFKRELIQVINDQNAKKQYLNEH